MIEPNPAEIVDTGVALAPGGVRFRVVRLVLAVLVMAAVCACAESPSKSRRLSSDSCADTSRRAEAAAPFRESGISDCPLRLTVCMEQDVVSVSSDSGADARAELRNVSDHAVSIYKPGLMAVHDDTYPDVRDEEELDLDDATETLVFGDEHGPPFNSLGYAAPSGDRSLDFVVLMPGECLEFRLDRPMYEPASVTWRVQYKNTDVSGVLNTPAWTGAIEEVVARPIKVLFDEGSLKHFSEILQSSQDVEDRRRAANILSRQRGLKLKVIPVLLSAMLNDKDERVRSSAAYDISWLARRPLGLPPKEDDFRSDLHVPDVREWAEKFLAAH